MLFGKRKRHVKRIMIVEDEPLVAFENEVMLGEAGYTVVATVDNLASALETLDKESVDLILSDISLAGEGSGLDLAREARRRGIPVLFATGHVPPEAPQLAIGSLTKPYSDRTLRAALESVDRHIGGEAARSVSGLELYPVDAG